MRLAFVHSYFRTTVSYSHAIAAIAGQWKRQNCDLQISVFCFDGENDTASLKKLVSFAPDIVLFSAMTSQWNLHRKLATDVKYLVPEAMLVVGGTHVTALSGNVGQSEFDVAVVGEGEEVLDDLLQLKQETQKTGFVKVVGPRIVYGQPVRDLDELAIPDFELFSPTLVNAYPSLMFSRGCPYSCNYCMSRKGGFGGSVRWKSPTKAIAEIRALVKYCDPKELYFDDDTILKNPKWIIEFCRQYSAEFDTPFFCNARPETVKPRLVEELVKAGCRAIGIGIESGSADIRRRLGRPMSDEKILRSFEIAHSAGLDTWSFNMVGVPGETIEDLEKTIELNRMAKVGNVRVSVYTDYPGAPMGQDAVDQHYGYFRSPFDLPREIAQRYRRWLLDLEAERRLWLTTAEKTELRRELNGRG